MKDKLFICIAIILVVLFTASVLQNIQLCRARLNAPYKVGSVDMDKTLTRLEQTGLQPREADYYQVMNE